MIGIDYAWGRPDPESIKALGYSFVVRYLSHDSSKNLTVAERKALVAAGLNVVIVWESTAGRALQGAAAGAADGAEARRQAALLGFGPKTVIYWAVDRDVDARHWDAIEAYGRAFGEAIRPTYTLHGLYGEYDLVREMVERRKLTPYSWQCGAWSNGRMWHGATLYQRIKAVTIDGVDCDENIALQPDYGGWLPAPEPVPFTGVLKEDDMELIRLRGTAPVYLVGLPGGAVPVEGDDLARLEAKHGPTVELEGPMFGAWIKAAGGIVFPEA